MKSLNFRNSILLLCFVLTTQLSAFSQFVPQGFFYQTELRNPARVIMPNQSVGFLFSIYATSISGTPVWQESHSLTSDDYGLVKTIVGTGTSTGVGSLSSFSQINWGASNYFIQVAIDSTGGTSYTPMGFSPFFSAPYVLHSKKADQLNGLALSELYDVNVDSLGVGKVLKWNGSYWVPSLDFDSDTALYSMNTNYAVTSDTALYTYGNLVSDTVQFAYTSDSSLYSNSSMNTSNAVNTINSDTALYAINSSPFAWRLNGNTGTLPSNFLGSNDNIDVLIKTNNSTRVLLKNNGSLFLGSTSITANLSQLSIDGFMSVGQVDSTFTPVAGAGTKLLWYPGLASFRVGAVSGNQWDTANIGKHSIAVGYNTKAGIASFTSGYECETVDYGIAMGRKSMAMGIGAYPGGNSVALGDSCYSIEKRAVTIGRNNLATGPTSIAIGFSNLSLDDKTTAIGSFCNATGVWSTAIGYMAASMHRGSFVYADASVNTPVSTTINDQFIVRSSGGTIFYSDSLCTTGVMLNAGSGSWSVVSDKNKKENFLNVDYESTLKKISQLKITTWNYKSQADSIIHIGPMAQEFYRLFHFGENRKTISTVDMDGVILAGIKALNIRLYDLEKINEIDKCKIKAESLHKSSKDLNERLNAIEHITNDF